MRSRQAFGAGQAQATREPAASTIIGGMARSRSRWGSGPCSEKVNQAIVQQEACREEPLLAPTEEYNIDLTTAGMKKDLQAMEDFSV